MVLLKRKKSNPANLTRPLQLLFLSSFQIEAGKIEMRHRRAKEKQWSVEYSSVDFPSSADWEVRQNNSYPILISSLFSCSLPHPLLFASQSGLLSHYYLKPCSSCMTLITINQPTRQPCTQINHLEFNQQPKEAYGNTSSDTFKKTITHLTLSAIPTYHAKAVQWFRSLTIQMTATGLKATSSQATTELWI